MPAKIKPLLASLISILLLSSCCNEKDIYYSYPDEAVRYYNEHDTIWFYSEETQTYEKFIVCENKEIADPHTPADRCEQTTYFVSKRYECYKDSCNSENYFILEVAPTIILYKRRYNNIDSGDNLWIDSLDSMNSTIEIKGQTYENTIYITNSSPDSLIGIWFSYEYGVIQRVYENATFNLVYDED